MSYPCPILQLSDLVGLYAYPCLCLCVCVCVCARVWHVSRAVFMIASAELVVSRTVFMIASAEPFWAQKGSQGDITLRG